MQETRFYSLDWGHRALVDIPILQNIAGVYTSCALSKHVSIYYVLDCIKHERV